MRRDLVMGVFFLCLGLFGIFVHLFEGTWQYLFWFSNHLALLLALGFFLRNKFIFSYAFVLGILPELAWVIDFLIQIAGGQFLGISDYMFVPGYPRLLFFLALQHGVNLLGILYGIKRFGFHQKAWIGGLVHGIAIWILGFFLSTELNVNCSWQNCMAGLQISNTAWQIAWPLFMIMQIFVVYCCAKFLFRASVKTV